MSRTVLYSGPILGKSSANTVFRNVEAVDTAISSIRKSKIFNILTGVDTSYHTQFGKLFLDNEYTVINTTPLVRAVHLYALTCLVGESRYYILYFLVNDTVTQKDIEEATKRKEKCLFTLTHQSIKTIDKLKNPYTAETTYIGEKDYSLEIDEDISELSSRLTEDGITNEIVLGDKLSNGDVCLLFKKSPDFISATGTLGVTERLIRVPYTVNHDDTVETNITTDGNEAGDGSFVFTDYTYVTTDKVSELPLYYTSTIVRTPSQRKEAGTYKVREFDPSTVQVTGYDNIIAYLRNVYSGYPSFGTILFNLCNENIRDVFASSADNWAWGGGFSGGVTYHGVETILPPNYIRDVVKPALTLRLESYKIPKNYRFTNSNGNTFIAHEKPNYNVDKNISYYMGLNYGDGVPNRINYNGLQEYEHVVSYVEAIPSYAYSFFVTVPDEIYNVFKAAIGAYYNAMQGLANAQYGANASQWWADIWNYINPRAKTGYVGTAGGIGNTHIQGNNEWLTGSFYYFNHGGSLLINDHNVVFDYIKNKFYITYMDIVTPVNDTLSIWENLDNIRGDLYSYKNLPEHGLSLSGGFPSNKQVSINETNMISYVTNQDKFFSKRYQVLRDGVKFVIGDNPIFEYKIESSEVSLDAEEQTIPETDVYSINITYGIALKTDKKDRDGIVTVDDTEKVSSTNTANTWIDNPEDGYPEYKPFDNAGTMTDMQLEDKLYCTGLKVRRGLTKLTEEGNHFVDENNYYCDEKKHQVDFD